MTSWAERHPLLTALGGSVLAPLGATGVLTVAGYAARFAKSDLLGVDLLQSANPQDLLAEGSRFVAQTTLLLVGQVFSWLTLVFALVPLLLIAFIAWRRKGTIRDVLKNPLKALSEAIASPTFFISLAAVCLLEIAYFDLPLVTIKNVLTAQVVKTAEPDSSAGGEAEGQAGSGDGSVRGADEDETAEEGARHAPIALAQPSLLVSQLPVMNSECTLAPLENSGFDLPEPLDAKASRIWGLLVCSRLSGLQGCRPAADSKARLSVQFSFNAWLTIVFFSFAVSGVGLMLFRRQRQAIGETSSALVLLIVVVLDLILLPVAYGKLYSAGLAEDIVVYYEEQGAEPLSATLNGFLLTNTANRLIFFNQESSFGPGVWSLNEANVKRVRVTGAGDVLAAAFGHSRAQDCPTQENEDDPVQSEDARPASGDATAADS